MIFWAIEKIRKKISCVYLFFLVKIFALIFIFTTFAARKEKLFLETKKQLFYQI
jgi:hypothetical protein